MVGRPARRRGGRTRLVRSPPVALAGGSGLPGRVTARTAALAGQTLVEPSADPPDDLSRAHMVAAGHPSSPGPRSVGERGRRTAWARLGADGQAGVMPSAATCAGHAEWTRRDRSSTTAWFSVTSSFDRRTEVAVGQLRPAVAPNSPSLGPSAALTMRAGGQRKATMDGPLSACRRTFQPPSCRSRDADPRRRAAAVCRVQPVSRRAPRAQASWRSGGRVRRGRGLAPQFTRRWLRGGSASATPRSLPRRACPGSASRGLPASPGSAGSLQERPSR